MNISPADFPAHRHNRYGKQLLDYAKDIVRTLGGKTRKLGIIEESTVLKNWYLENSFDIPEPKI